jgi:hypothetical protein
MNNVHIAILVAVSAATSFPLPAQAQDTEEAAVNFVRERAQFLTAETYAAADSSIEDDATGRSDNPTAIAYLDFKALVEKAVEEGRGGIINFEEPFYQGILREPDRTWITPRWFDIVETDEYINTEDKDNYRWRTFAELVQQVDETAVIAVENRLDVTTDVRDGSERPIRDDVRFNELEVIYGTDFEKSLIIEKGRTATGAFATDGAGDEFDTGPIDLFRSYMTNFDFHFTVGTGDVEVIPTSGSRYLSGTTQHDLQFSYADRITAASVAFLSKGYFQFYQGEGGKAAPTNPDNAIAEASFWDGSSIVAATFAQPGVTIDANIVFDQVIEVAGPVLTADWAAPGERVNIEDYGTYRVTARDATAGTLTVQLEPTPHLWPTLPVEEGSRIYRLERVRSTTDQVIGTNDMFFGFVAPEGFHIMSLFSRVVGQNARAILHLDDVAFIAEDVPPSMTSETLAQGGEGRPFYYRLTFNRQPMPIGADPAVSLEGLPAGLTLNEDLMLVEGTPSVSGTFDVDVTARNDFDEQTSQLTIEIVPIDAVPDGELGEQLYPIISPAEGSLVLKRTLVPIAIPLAANRGSADEPDPAAGENVSQVQKIDYFGWAYRLDLNGNRIERREIRDLQIQIDLPVQQIEGEDGEIFRWNVPTITGSPQREELVGSYELDIYAVNPFGGSQTTVRFDVFPPVVAPNFDGDLATDLMVRSADGTTVLSYASSLFLDGDGRVQVDQATLAPILTGISPGAELHIGDFNGDALTDILEYIPSPEDPAAFAQMILHLNT